MRYKERTQTVYIGQERAGKTYLAKKYAMKYLQGQVGGIIAYNYGDRDFPEQEYHEIEPLTFAEHVQYFYSQRDAKRNYMLNKQVEYFWFNNEIYHFRHFNEMFKLRKVRIAKIYERPLERKFVLALFKYVSDFLLILDDTRMIFANGISAEFQNLFGRKNHTGKYANKAERLGLDVVCIFHSLDTVNPELWAYTNTAILFKTTTLPSFRKVDDKEFIKQITRIWSFLKDAPKYTAIRIDLKGDERLIPKLVKA